MKKMRSIWGVYLITFISVFFYQSCDLDDDGGYYYPGINADKVTIATVKAVSDDEDETEFYFLIDSGKKLYPGNKNSIPASYKWVDGQRAFVYFDLLDEKVSGYDYNAKIVYIENILTKGVIDMDEETADSIGDDRINLTYMWFGGDHLNIEFQFLGTRNPKELHMVNLVHNKMAEQDEESEYLELEFRHNDHGDYRNERLTGIVSFKPPYAEDITKYKGIRIRVNTIYDGIKFKEIDFKSETTERSETYSGNAIEIQ